VASLKHHLASPASSLANPKIAGNAWLGKYSSQKKSQKIASSYFSIFLPQAIFTELRISGDFDNGQTAGRAGQMVFQAGHIAMPGWTLCHAK
jgi:hypothetical protein